MCPTSFSSTTRIIPLIVKVLLLSLFHLEGTSSAIDAQGSTWTVSRIEFYTVDVEIVTKVIQGARGTRVTQIGHVRKQELRIAEDEASWAKSTTLPVVLTTRNSPESDDDCTGFFVTEKGFLTAGHCLGTDTTVYLNPKGINAPGMNNFTMRSATCRVLEDNTSGIDWAICNLDGSAYVSGPFLKLAKCESLPKKVRVFGLAGGTLQKSNFKTGSVSKFLQLTGVTPGDNIRPGDSGAPATRIGASGSTIDVVGIVSEIGSCSAPACVSLTITKSFEAFVKNVIPSITFNTPPCP